MEITKWLAVNAALALILATAGCGALRTTLDLWDTPSRVTAIQAGLAVTKEKLKESGALAADADWWTRIIGGAGAIGAGVLTYRNSRSGAMKAGMKADIDNLKKTNGNGHSAPVPGA